MVPQFKRRDRAAVPAPDKLVFPLGVRVGLSVEDGLQQFDPPPLIAVGPPYEAHEPHRHHQQSHGTDRHIKPGRHYPRQVRERTAERAAGEHGC